MFQDRMFRDGKQDVPGSEHKQQQAESRREKSPGGGNELFKVAGKAEKTALPDRRE